MTEAITGRLVLDEGEVLGRILGRGRAHRGGGAGRRCER